MADPTPLSPAARAVLTAVTWKKYDVPPEGLPAFAEEMAPLIAAALRALTDQVMPERPLWSRKGAELTLYHEGRLDAAIRFRAEILAIAAELENTND